MSLSEKAASDDSLGGGDAPVDDTARLRRVMRKIDLRVLPIASAMYLFSFLDRSAIGNAKVAGMNASLHLTYAHYSLAVSMFFVVYCLAEVFANLLLKRLGARYWLPTICVLWGLTMACTGLVTNFAGLLSLRILLGLCESGLFPGITYLLSSLYPRRFIQLRLGLFFSAATLAGAFGGLLAYGLEHVKTARIRPWAWIFIVEGLLTIAVGIASFFILFSSLDDAKFLSVDDRAFMKQRVEHDETDVPMDDSYKRAYVIAALCDAKVWTSTLAFFCGSIPLYSMALTLPTILKESMHYSTVDAQLMTVPVYGVAAVVCVCTSFAADRYQVRCLPLILAASISAIGWAVGYAYPDNGSVRYAAMFLSSCSYTTVPTSLALVSQNQGGQTKRAVALGIQIGVGGSGALVSSNIFQPRWGPDYMLAYKLNITFNCVVVAVTAVNWAMLHRANARKRAYVEAGSAAQLTPDELAQMGDASPFFVYRY